MPLESQAYCTALPEETAWQGVQRQTAQTLCLQRELSEMTEDRAAEVRWKAQLSALAARTELLLQQQRAAGMLNR
jgi:hypothetical protein